MGMVGNTTDANVAASQTNRWNSCCCTTEATSLAPLPQCTQTNAAQRAHTYITSQFSSAHHLRQRQVLLGLHPL